MNKKEGEKEYMRNTMGEKIRVQESRTVLFEGSWYFDLNPNFKKFHSALKPVY